MSDLIKNALANMQAKRIKRIEDTAKRSQIPDVATYQGKSTIDGTDIIQVGANEPTSGYRIISNAPLSVGEKVSLRPSAIGGLQRVDARNRPIAATQEAVEIELILGSVVLRAFDVFVFSGNSTSGQPKSNFRALTEASGIPVVTYNYENYRLANIGFGFTESGVIGASPPENNINPALSTALLVATTEAIFLNVSLNAAFISLPPTAPSAELFSCVLAFPVSQWQRRFIAFGITLDNGESQTYAWSESPIELDVRGGISPNTIDDLSSFGVTGAQIRISRSGENYFLSSVLSTAFINSFPVGSLLYQFSIRWRRKTPEGDLPWFRL